MARRTLALVALLAAGLVYVGNAWSPSSYGFVLAHVGAASTGVVWGTPRTVRADEYAVVTPLTQATVNNGYARRNRTSLYGEDLRINYGLPLRDWGLAFKPTMWLYGVAPPAYAYSFHWFATAALFLAGYALLLRWMGASGAVALLLSAGLWCTGVVQFWWNEKGPIFALFPWVLLPFATRWPLALKAAAFAWATVAWLLVNFYPPVHLTLAFVGALLLASLDPELLARRRLAVIAVAAAIAAGLTTLYLGDYLAAANSTLYPGQRRVGGGDVPARHFLSWLLPAVNFDRSYESTIGDNISQAGTLGLYYAFAAACFLDFSCWRALCDDRTLRRRVALLGGALLALLAWMTLPLPAGVGAALLWDRVPAARMHFAAGLAFVLLTFTLVQGMGLRLRVVRLALFVAVVLAGWWRWKAHAAGNGFEDLAIVPLIVAAYAVGRARPAHAHAAILGASTLAGAFLFAGFNPVQSAVPIFARSPTPVTQALDRYAEANGGVLAITGLPGATANGLGYRAVNHVNAVPQLAFWRSQFPGLDDAEFARIFNRYAHIMPAAEPAPRLVRFDAIFVPVDRFAGVGAMRTAPGAEPDVPRGGSIDAASIEDGSLVLWGWAPWTGPVAGHELELVLEPPPAGAPARATVLRADLAAHFGRGDAALNGFLLRIPLSDPARLPATCVYARDPAGTHVWLPNPANLPSCVNATPR